MSIDELLEEKIKNVVDENNTLPRSEDLKLFKFATIENNFTDQEYRDFLKRKGIMLPQTPPPEPTPFARIH